MNRQSIMAAVVLAVSITVAGPARAQTDPVSQYYMGLLYKPELYQRPMNLQTQLAMLRSDAKTLRDWSAYLKGRLDEMDRGRDLLARRAAVENRSRAEHALAVQARRSRMEEISAREQAVAAADASDSAEDFRRRTDGVRRIGIVNDSGYFYRFYDGDGNLARSAIDRERSGVAWAWDVEVREGRRLSTWSSAIESYRAESQRISAATQPSNPQQFLETAGRASAAIRAQNQRAAAYRRNVARYNQQARVRQAAAEPGDDGDDYDTDGLQRDLQDLLNEKFMRGH